ncbi:MAG: hypothetical protein AB8E87_12330 [Prochlorococcus sp.]
MSVRSRWPFGSGQHYEQRQLFALIWLRQTRARMVFVTSKLLPDMVLDSVLELLPGVPFSHARQRLCLFDTDDASPRPLAAKLLERPRLLQRIRDSLRPGRSYLSCYNVGELECRLSEALQLPLMGCDPKLAPWGHKAGGRELFRRCGLPHPEGSELVFSAEGLLDAALELIERCPGLQRVVVKLNAGFSGEGNARLELEALQLADCSAAERRDRLRLALDTLPMPAVGWQAQLPDQGALVEEWLEGGDELTSPSVQGLIHPGGQVEVLSTHEQQLGGDSGQVYLGCQFPALVAYRLELQRWGQAVGEALARLGALDHFSVDGLAGPPLWGSLGSAGDRGESAQRRHHPPPSGAALPQQRPHGCCHRCLPVPPGQRAAFPGHGQLHTPAPAGSAADGSDRCGG